MTSHSLTRLRAAVRGLYEISTASPRITVLEGLRGLAVLLVFFVHYHALFGAYARSNPLLWRVSHALGSIGNAGVDLFFVLSGYLIYGMLLRPGCSTLTFWRRRIVRVYPAFLAVLLLYLALSAVFPGRSKVGGSALGAALYVLENLLLLPGVFDIKPIVTVTWSLSYEFAFYWSLPVVIWLTGMRRWTSRWRTVFFIVIFTVSLACAFQAARSHCRLLMFVPGILLYEAVHAERESSGR